MSTNCFKYNIKMNERWRSGTGFGRGKPIHADIAMCDEHYTYGLNRQFLQNLGIMGPLVPRVFVANLDYSVDEKLLNDVFRLAGKVISVNLYKDKEGKSRGYGQIEFDHPVEAVQAITMLHGQTLNERNITVRMDSSPPKKEEMSETRLPAGLKSVGMGLGPKGFPLKNAARCAENMEDDCEDPMYGNTYGLTSQFLQGLGITGPLVTRVFVANLDYNVTEKKLEDVFRLAGKVISVNLQKDNDGKSKGYGQVEFDHPLEAVQAISMFAGQTLYDRLMAVKLDRTMKRDTTGHFRLPIGLRSIGLGLGSGGAPLKNISRVAERQENMDDDDPVYGNTFGLTSQFLRDLGITGPLISRVFIANLDYTVDEKILEEVFRLAGKIISVDLHKDKDGKSKGYGQIEYEHSLEAVQAISMFAGQGLHDRKMAVKLDRSMKKDQVGPPRLPRGLKGLGMGLGPHGTALKNVASAYPKPSGRFGDGMSPGKRAYPMRSPQEMGSGGFGNGVPPGKRPYPMTPPGVKGSTNFGNGTESGKGDKIIVRNLPPHYTWQHLGARCSEFGNVKLVELKDEGVGVVRFGSEEEARRAINMMHRTRIEGRLVEVFLH